MGNAVIYTMTYKSSIFIIITLTILIIVLHHSHKKGMVVITNAGTIIVSGLILPIADAQGKSYVPVIPSTRQFSDWQDAFQLSRIPRQQSNLCIEFQAFSTEHFPTLLTGWWGSRRLIRSRPTYQEVASVYDYPTSQSGQDALTAIVIGAYLGNTIHRVPFDGEAHRQRLPSIMKLRRRSMPLWLAYFADLPKHGLV